MSSAVEGSGGIDEPMGQRSRSLKRDIGLALIAVGLFTSGVIIAPEPTTEGVYNVSLFVGDQKIEFTITLNTTQNDISEQITLRSGGLSVYYLPTYLLEPGEKLTFYVSSSTPISELKGWMTHNMTGVRYEYTALIEDTYSAKFTFKVLTDTRVALGLLFMVSFLWLTELVPLAASSLLIPVVLVVYDVQGATTAFASFSQPIIFLFLAGFLLAEAMHRTSLDKFISYRLFSVIPPNGKILMFALMALSAVFSMFMSNTAAVAILIPLTLQLLKGVDVGDATYRKTVILGIAYSATVGGIGSLIGTPPNIIAAELLAEFDPTLEINFAEWFLFGLPVVVVMLPIVFVYLWMRYRPEVDNAQLRQAQAQTRTVIDEKLQVTRDQAFVMGVFVVTFALWMTTSIHGISSSIIAVGAAVLLFFTGHLKESDLKEINWSALLTFGGGLALGSVVIQTGLADYIGTKASVLSGLPPLVIIAAVGLVALILTAFASNTASAVILIPVVIPLGYIIGFSPMVLAVLVAVMASIDFAIVIGTPPTMMAYSTGLYSVKEIFRTGIVLDIVGLLVVTVLATFLYGEIVDLLI